MLVPHHISPETPLSEIEFCVIDTETTGGRPEWCRVIDVAVFRFKGGQIIQKFQSLINPQAPIPIWITALTGIDQDMVSRAPTFDEIMPQLLSVLKDGVFTAHNAGFDFGFIQQEFFRAGTSYDSHQCCTVKLARMLFPDIGSRSLGFLCDHLMIDISDRHRAAGDAEATVYVLKNMLEILARVYNVKTWRDLQIFQKFGALTLPKSFKQSDIFNLPEKPGMYFLKDAEGNVLAKGKVTNIQRRIKTFFKETNRTVKSNRLRELTEKIEFSLDSSPL